jgi:hypothetical protein
MTLNELIEELQDIVANDEELGDAPVLLAHQPNWPLAFTVDTITVDHCGFKAEDGEENAPVVVWIAEGGHAGRPYAPKHAWDGGEVFADDEDEEEGQ